MFVKVWPITVVMFFCGSDALVNYGDHIMTRFLLLSKAREFM